MKNLNDREYGIIEREYNAFNNNFESISILKNNGSYMVYLESEVNGNDENWHNNYKYYADNIQVIKGWLYGCVQANNGVIRAL